MDNKNFLHNAREFHHHCLTGSFIHAQSSMEEGGFVYSDLITDSYWNYLFSPRLTKSFDDRVRKAFREKHRTPCVILNSDTPAQIREHLSLNGFTKTFEEVWMRYAKTKINPVIPSQASTISCQTSSDFESYLKIFFSSYAGSDPNEPYGALPPAYGVAFERAFALRTERGLQFFLLLWDEEPVGCAMMAISKQFACLYGLGIKPSHRRLGLGKLLTEHRIKIAREQGTEIIFLQTEANSYNEKLFRNFGFETVEVCEGFVIKA